ncbi:GNAT family N-acetyltransferase [Williamsia sterculiae]|uniref:N-acetyltransferase domain-containing protein n=1 Tax=Williamsia sterculiae TaxID=1344003 RepID=A0A1N7GEH8_9NOCA|nr:GNAT family N-acetyltransferase [Williamsia sterculiae]SIS10960.1 hypothetical protein SAMN05445060_2688 [Williamsia sterculiae]
MLKLLGDRPLGARDSEAVARALDLDPVAMCMVAARFEEHGLTPRLLGGEMWSNGDPAAALCFSGANLIPMLGGPRDIDAFVERAVRAARICSSIVGRSDLVLPFWEQASDHWGPAREIRDHQPLLAMSGDPACAPDERVRRVGLDDLDAYLPAAIDMFVNEVGVDPCGTDGGRSYRRRITSLIAAGRAYARFDRGEVVFKAEVGSMSRRVGQIQGVWVAPHRRGEGLGAAGTAAVVRSVVARGRIASLYVNGFNDPARGAYRRVGFAEVGTFATILVD